MYFAKCYWPMDLVEPFVRENWCADVIERRAQLVNHPLAHAHRARWERDKPFWFDEDWKRRIPRTLLQGIECTVLVSQQEAAFRNAVEGIEPWGLGARELTDWLRDHWAPSDTQPANDEAKRIRLVRRLSDTDGFELLTKCMTKTSKVPWAKLSQTKTGEPIKDEERAEQLTMFLHGHAGLCFYHQTWHASVDPLSPLLKYDCVRIFDQGDDGTAIAVVVRHQSAGLRLLKFASDSNTRSRVKEIEMHTRASAASENIIRTYESGTSSPGICYGTSEYCSMFLCDLISSNGIDDDQFWRWASQLARGVMELHRAGIWHGALLV